MTTVFLTGFPGFLGSALVELLLERHDADTTVTCLVQSKYRSTAESRAAEIAADADAEGRIDLVEGDITEADLGLGDEYDDVRAETVEVYHLAAIYDLTMDREPGRRVNIEGTRHVLEFAAGADLEGSGVECPRFEDYAEALVAFVRENPDVDEGAMT